MQDKATGESLISVGVIDTGLQAAIFGSVAVATLLFNPAGRLEGLYAGNRRNGPNNPFATYIDSATQGTSIKITQRGTYLVEAQVILAIQGAPLGGLPWLAATYNATPNQMNGTDFIQVAGDPARIIDSTVGETAAANATVVLNVKSPIFVPQAHADDPNAAVIRFLLSDDSPAPIAAAEINQGRYKITRLNDTDL